MRKIIFLNEKPLYWTCPCNEKKMIKESYDDNINNTLAAKKLLNRNGFGKKYQSPPSTQKSPTSNGTGTSQTVGSSNPSSTPKPPSSNGTGTSQTVGNSKSPDPIKQKKLDNMHISPMKRQNRYYGLK